ncbi:MAG: T9SS type A sorting domain-containing protein [Saprospiraceae bacterium]|nr:T9SS type A sorting domain-containing protein [Saprospiraceae bacterium]
MDASDGIVSRLSQMAGLDPNTNPKMISEFSNIYHTSILGDAIYDDPTVGKRVDELLNTSMHDPKFGFIPATSVQKVQKASTRQNPVKFLTDKVQILYPLAGASRNINDSLTIKIKAEIKDLSLLILQFQGKTITIPSPKDSLISLPWQVSADHIETQEIQLTGLYKTGSTTAFSTARTNITVKALGNIQEWTVTPTFMIMEKGSIRRPKYEAIFDQSVSLVGASSSITASIDDKTIVSYRSSTNEFTALKPGIATINLNYMGKSATISIEVIEHKDPNKDTTGVTAVDDLNLNTNEKIQIHPNPVTDNEVHITTNGGIQDPIQIKLMDLSGRNVHILNNPMKQSPNKLMLKLSPEIEDGIYIISIRYPQSIVSKKLWIKRNIK